MLLGVVGQSLKPVKLLAVHANVCNKSQQFWKLFANNVVSLCKGLLKLSIDNRNFSHFWLCKLKLELISR